MGAFQQSLSRALDRVYAKAGLPAVYTGRDAVAHGCSVLVESDLSRYGQTAQVNVRTAVVAVRTSEVALAPRRGEQFVVTGGATYTVDSLQATDALQHKVFVA